MPRLALGMGLARETLAARVWRCGMVAAAKGGIMGLFDNLAGDVGKKKIIDPGRLFRSLPNREDRFVSPRDIQAEVWDDWFARRSEHDLILKMNTGSGKTVVGLIILQSSLHESVGPALYLVPDKHLQRQVISTATALGIRTTTEPNDQGFRRGESILVVTMAKLINGLSQFGVRGARNNRFVDIGALVVDDAHASIPLVEKQFSLRVSDTKTYSALRSLFADDIKAQSRAGWIDVQSGTGSTVVPVPYWAWQNKLDKATAILSGQAGDDDNKFVWPLIREHLHLCDVAITPTEVEVALPIPFLDSVPSFTGAKRRIYMTATLADDSIVVSRLGADPTTVLTPVTPEYASDLGDRMILTPIQTSRAVTIDEVKSSMADFARSHNVVVIVPSSYRSKAWAPYTSEIHDKDSITECVARLTKEHVGLVVFIAKYDGVDLPGAACRILVIDGLPERYSPMERIVAGALGDTEAMRVNQIQRIEQGMGRGVRSATDYAAVVLLDPRLVERLDRNADLDVLSPGTRAQMELARALEKTLAGSSIEKFKTAIGDFLNRDPAWTTQAKEVIDALPYPTPVPLPAHVLAERKAFELALQGRLQEAAGELLKDINDVDDAWLRGWLKQRAASFLHDGNPTRARDIQASALIDNNFICRIPGNVKVPRITHAGQQAALASLHLGRTYSDSKTLSLQVEALIANLTPAPVPGSHKEFEQALQDLGSLLGFSSQRPDNDFRVGPDNLWATGGDHYFVIECKSEATASRVSRDDLEQLTHSVDWFEKKYDEPRYSATPILIHPSQYPHFDAIPRQGSRVLTFEKLAQLRDAVWKFGLMLASESDFSNENIVKLALTQNNLLGGQFVQHWTQEWARDR